jgi:hypothetical protein
MSATRTAAAMAPGEPVAWGGVERAAFEDFPVVVSALQGEGKVRALGLSLIYMVPLGILVAVTYGAPILGLAIVVGPYGPFGSMRELPERDIAVASVIFAVTAISILVHGCIWIWSGRPANTALLGSAGMALALGAVAAGIATRRSVEHSVSDWGLWILPMLACTVLGAVFIFLVRRARRRAAAAAEPAALPSDFRASEAYLAAVRESISRVGDEDLESIRKDLAAAIDDLEQRHVITQADAQNARRAELGALAGHMRSESADRADRL